MKPLIAALQLQLQRIDAIISRANDSDNITPTSKQIPSEPAPGDKKVTTVMLTDSSDLDADVNKKLRERRVVVAWYAATALMVGWWFARVGVGS